jgi:hypothetical protein
MRWVDMWKFWGSFAIDTGKQPAAAIPHVSKIQGELINSARRSINSKLCERGRAEFFVDGLLPASIELVLNECHKQGYQVWYRKNPSTGSGDYNIAVNECKYLTDYFDRVFTIATVQLQAIDEHHGSVQG